MRWLMPGWGRRTAMNLRPASELDPVSKKVGVRRDLKVPIDMINLQNCYQTRILDWILWKLKRLGGLSNITLIHTFQSGCLWLTTFPCIFWAWIHSLLWQPLSCSRPYCRAGASPYSSSDRGLVSHADKHVALWPHCTRRGQQNPQSDNLK